MTRRRSIDGDVALLVTTICFVDDIPRTVAEARRILQPGGSLVIGYIDRTSPVGRTYQEQKAANPFYAEAVFVSTEELLAVLEGAGFTAFEFVQTIFRPIDQLAEPDPVQPGYGDGSFVAMKATR